MKSEVIDQSALKGAVESAVSRVFEQKRAAAKDEIVSNEAKNRGGRVRRALEVGAESESFEAHPGVAEDAIDAEFSEAELREFLAADYLETHADPAFKESLRKKLWALVSDRYGRGSSSSK